jgi:hypothetical protein
VQSQAHCEWHLFGFKDLPEQRNKFDPIYQEKPCYEHRAADQFTHTTCTKTLPIMKLQIIQQAITAA